MIYCRTGSSNHPKLFCAHLDTVEPGRGVSIKEEDGYLVSEGKTIIAGDNKVNLACILYSIGKLIEENKDADVELLFSVREETDSGIQAITRSLISSKVGFVYDLGGAGNFSDVVINAPTIWDFKVEITGKSSHGARPEEGVNVLEGFLNLKGKLKLGRLDKFSTLNIGIIRGGDATNTVPGFLKLEGDIRSTDSEIFEVHKKELEKTLKSIEKNNNLKVNLIWIPYAYGYSLDLDSQNYNKLKQLYKDEFNISLNNKTVTSGSDAGFLNYIGVETFC
ncbi:MAG: peptidase dimerization domain-containing protein [Candidatus Dojkabacteria bacterium]|nr:peptidase dimerization domain-containing protein [Candidatus Dojkabacteria bacterium]